MHKWFQLELKSLTLALYFNIIYIIATINFHSILRAKLQLKTDFFYPCMHQASGLGRSAHKSHQIQISVSNKNGLFICGIKYVAVSESPSCSLQFFVPHDLNPSRS